MPRILQAEREARGLTHEMLAERAGVHATTIGKVERGRQIPSIALLALIARALDCSVADLVARALPDFAGSPESDEALSFVKSLPTAWRSDLVRVLRALMDWKGATLSRRRESASGSQTRKSKPR